MSRVARLSHIQLSMSVPPVLSLLGPVRLARFVGAW
jgi:hypothetical protein